MGLKEVEQRMDSVRSLGKILSPRAFQNFMKYLQSKGDNATNVKVSRAFVSVPLIANNSLILKQEFYEDMIANWQHRISTPASPSPQIPHASVPSPISPLCKTQLSTIVSSDANSTANFTLDSATIAPPVQPMDTTQEYGSNIGLQTNVDLSIQHMDYETTQEYTSTQKKRGTTTEPKSAPSTAPTTPTTSAPTSPTRASPPSTPPPLTPPSMQTATPTKTTETTTTTPTITTALTLTPMIPANPGKQEELSPSGTPSRVQTEV